MALSGVQYPDSSFSQHLWPWGVPCAQTSRPDGVLQTITNMSGFAGHRSVKPQKDDGWGSSGRMQPNATDCFQTDAQVTWQQALTAPDDLFSVSQLWDDGTSQSDPTTTVWPGTACVQHESTQLFWPVQAEQNSALVDSGINLSCMEEEVDGTACEASSRMSQTTRWQPRLINIGSSRSVSLEGCEDYETDILDCMRKGERDHCVIRPDFMDIQADITPTMRSILVNWLVEVAGEFEFNNITLHQAVNYLDRYLADCIVPRVNLQLVGVAAIFIAAKMEEVDVPGASRFAYITDNTYTVEQVVKMESVMLCSLGYELAVPTSYAFVLHFTQRCPTDDHIVCLALYLCELALMDAFMVVSFLPSEIAAASVCLARHTLLRAPHQPWTFNLTFASSYSMSDILPCVQYLDRAFLEAPHAVNRAILEKYRQPRFKEVANLKPLPVLPSIDNYPLYL